MASDNKCDNKISYTDVNVTIFVELINLCQFFFYVFSIMI